jgi:hypothetical protein
MSEISLSKVLSSHLRHGHGPLWAWLLEVYIFWVPIYYSFQSDLHTHTHALIGRYIHSGRKKISRWGIKFSPLLSSSSPAQTFTLNLLSTTKRREKETFFLPSKNCLKFFPLQSGSFLKYSSFRNGREQEFSPFETGKDNIILWRARIS